MAMSLQNSFTGVIASSSKLVQNINGKVFNGVLYQSKLSKKQNSYKTQPSTYLKTGLSNIIKDQLKSYRLQKKLKKQVEEFKRTNQKKKLVEDMHKVQKFRQKQSQVLRARFDVYQKEKQKRESVVEESSLLKKEIVVYKKKEHDQKVQSVRKRFFEYQNQDIEDRLLRVDSVTSHKSAYGKQSSLTHRSISIHNQLSNRQLMRSRVEDEEKMRITNYLRKMKHAESLVLLKQLNNEERKQKSIKTEVKTLTRQRNLMEEMKMKQLQQKFDTKMSAFNQNFSMTKMQNSTLQMNKSRMKYEIRQKVIRNKEMNDSILISKTLNNFMKRKADKQNLYQNHQRQIDLLRAKSSFMNNTIQVQKQQLEKQKEKSIRILYEKLQRIKHLKVNETLSLKERENLISLLDGDDLMYPEIIEFLNNTKIQFLKKKIEKEQQKAKADKNKKTTRFYNKN